MPNRFAKYAPEEEAEEPANRFDKYKPDSETQPSENRFSKYQSESVGQQDSHAAILDKYTKSKNHSWSPASDPPRDSNASGFTLSRCVFRPFQIFLAD